MDSVSTFYSPATTRAYAYHFRQLPKMVYAALAADSKPY